MKQIEDILKGIQTLKIEQIQHLPVSKICFDTRQVENNCVFVAQKGTKTDGHQFIPQAIAAGARYIVLEDIFTHRATSNMLPFLNISKHENNSSRTHRYRTGSG